MKRRKDGRFLKVVSIEGKKVYFYSSENTETKAEKDIKRQMMLYNQKQTEEENKNFKQLADEWNSEYRLTVPDITYKKGIKAQYKRIIDCFGDRRIKDIKARDVELFLRSLTYSQKTVSGHRCVLNMIFNFAVLRGYLEQNPVTYIKTPRGLSKTKRELPTTQELRIVSEHYSGFDLLPFFLLYTGCRKSEALAIRREDIDFENKIIKIRHHVIHDGNKPVYEDVVKTEAAFRDIILLDRLAAAIPKKFNGFLFSMNGDGKKPLSKGAYDKRWKSYCKRYDIDITAHQLRHGYATMLFEAGIDIKDTQELMGHSDIGLTRAVYTHIRDVRKIQTADKLNDFHF